MVLKIILFTWWRDLSTTNNGVKSVDSEALVLDIFNSLVDSNWNSFSRLENYIKTNKKIIKITCKTFLKLFFFFTSIECICGAATIGLYELKLVVDKEETVDLCY